MSWWLLITVGTALAVTLVVVVVVFLAVGGEGEGFKIVQLRVLIDVVLLVKVMIMYTGMNSTSIHGSKYSR